ncbi:diguanylate cyclase [Acetobacterium tundrae]|uniref:Diguanylate cyclase n=1 Tax=Acetobacterium tundrae TaxID=132932 RepID=A0ABR6WMJ1_9FIRM|nr:diguanylate cyclase [Acetobacterium tundrae]MBC3797488.1 diguanylate cyclase [Acetobacterium tundrae]
MNDQKENVAIFEEYFDQYMKAYMTERSLAQIEPLLADSIFAFGTGLNERTFNKQDALLQFEKDIEAAPDRIDIYYHHKHVHLLDPDNALGITEFDMSTTIMDQGLKINHLRLMLVMHRACDRIEIAGMHISLPTQVHDEDEVYPLKELEERTYVLRNMVEKRTKSLKEAYDELITIINQDHLTLLRSRHYFEESLLKEQNRFERFKRDYVLMLLDLDDFKIVNDQYGHQTGDEVLRKVALTISSQVRTTDIVARWGGDEFVILMPETNLNTAERIGKDIRMAIEAETYDIELKITLSIGITSAQTHHPEKECSMFESADKAMYRAKKIGRNQISCR